MVYLTAGLIDRGLDGLLARGRLLQDLRHREPSGATSTTRSRSPGGNGFMEEYPYEKALRDSRINMIFEGTNEILRVLVALSGMRDVGEDLKEVGRALKAPLSSLGILSDYAARKIRGRVAPGRLTKVAPELAAEGEIVAQVRRARPPDAVETLLRKYGKGVIEQGVPPGAARQRRDRSVRARSPCSRARRRRSRRGARRRRPTRSALAKAFVEGAKYRMVGHLKEMDKNRDAEQTAISETAYASLGYAFRSWA